MKGEYVIGVGNAFRGDDGVGLVVARRLSALALPGVTVLELSGEGTALVEAWGEADRVIVVDAVSSGAKAGFVYRLEAADLGLPEFFSGHSTHAFGLAEAIELARRLERLPDQLVVYGIEGQTFEYGKALSPEVEEAAGIVVERIAEELSGEYGRLKEEG
jgi:hydrogenase maturation protease